METIPPLEIESEEIAVPEPEAESEHPPAAGRVSLSSAFGGRSFLRETLETVILAALIFSVFQVLAGRFQVHGPSMEPTLHNGQYMIVSKAIYWIHPPERGDVIVFHPPDSPKEDYIKRIVGLPGEHIEIQDGIVWVNRVRLEEPYIISPGLYSGVWDLGEDEYFVLGDNRHNSSDSHTWGVLPGENIVGKAWLCYWPPDDWGMVAHHVFSPIAEQMD